MSAKALGTFVAGAVVGAGVMWLMGPQGAGVAGSQPEPALAGAESLAPESPKPTGGGEPAPLPNPARVEAPGGAESEAERDARPAAAALEGGRPNEVAPGEPKPRDGTPGVNIVPAIEKGGGGTVVLGDGTGAFTFRMLKTPEQVYGKELVATARTGDNASAEFHEVFEQLLESLALGGTQHSPEADERAHAARQLLDDLIAKGRLAPHQLAEIERRYEAAGAGSDQRQQLAAMLARAKANEPGVRGFLEALDASGDVQAARAALHAFEHPNRIDPAVHAWRRKIITDGAANGLLRDATDHHRMARWLNRQNAGEYVGALTTRLRRNDLQSADRGRLLRSIAAAGIHAPEASLAALQAASQGDADPKLAAYAKDAAALVHGGAANTDTLQKAWHQQFPPSEHSLSGGTIILEGDFGESEDTEDGEKK